MEDSESDCASSDSGLDTGHSNIIDNHEEEEVEGRGREEEEDEGLQEEGVTSHVHHTDLTDITTG